MPARVELIESGKEPEPRQVICWNVKGEELIKAVKEWVQDNPGRRWKIAGYYSFTEEGVLALKEERPNE